MADISPDINTGFYPQANPNALLGTAQDVVGLANAGAQNRLINTDAQIQHLNLVKSQVDYLSNGLGALASKPDLSPQDMLGFGQRAVQEGILSPDVFSTEMQQVNAAGGDPDKLRALATQYQLRALDAGQKFSAQFGTPSTIDTGNSVQPVVSSPLTGIHPLGAPIQKTLTPQDLATQTTVMRNGAPTAGTMGQALQAEGVNQLTAQPDQGANALTGQSAPTQPSFSPVPVGAAEAAQKTGAASGDMLAQARATASNYQQNILPLQQAIQHLDALGPNATGPGTEDINTIQSFLQSMGVPVTDPTKIQNYDELKKYLVQIGRANGNSGTNDQLAAALAGSPGTTVSTLANKDILRTLAGMARLTAAQSLTFDKSGQPDANFAKWATNFNTSADPRAYVFDLMSPDQRSSLVSGLNGAAKSKFVQSLRNAVALGLVTPPNAQQQ